MLLILALIGCGFNEHELQTKNTSISSEHPVTSSNVDTVPEILQPTRPPASLPGGKLVVRDCFQSSEQGLLRSKQSSGNGYGSSGGGIGTSARKPQSQAPVAPPSPSMSPDSSPAKPKLEAEKRDATLDPAPKELQARSENKAESDNAQGTLGDDRLDKSFEANEPSSEDRSSMDWGAKVYLSNDDSMSLASAQHLLHTVENGLPFSPAQIRPHELLNYFSFDTKAPEPGQLFGIESSASKTDNDLLSVAIAIKGATPPRYPLDLTVVLDRSGSMSAEGRMEYTKRSLSLVLNHLQWGDRFDLVLFDNQVCTPVENFVVGRDDIAILESSIAQLAPRGGTDIGIGLREGYRIATTSDRLLEPERNRRMMLLTDAQVNTGEVDPNLLAAIGEGYEKHGIRLTGIGVGVGFRDDVLNKLTERGKGAYVYLGSERVVDRIFGVGFTSLTQTIAHDVQFELDLPDSLAMQRFYGEEASTDPEDIQPIHYYAGTTQLFLQDLRVDPSKIQPTDPIVLTIRYTDALSGKPNTQRYTTTIGAMLDAEPHNLAKARALMSWTDLLFAHANRQDVCGAPLTTFRENSSRVVGDTEIAWVQSINTRLCPNAPQQMVSAPSTVSYKVKVDSDTPIAEVVLNCPGNRKTKSLSNSDTVARFTTFPGACQLVLQGAVPMSTDVRVSEVGGDITCIIRGGRLSCA